MKLLLSQAENSVKKRVIYEDGDSTGVSSWLTDVRHMQADTHYLTLEPPSLPIVSVGRAFATHLRNTAILTSYRVDPDLGTPDLSCKLNLNLEFGGVDFQISLDLACKYRENIDDFERGSLTKQAILDWLFERIVNNIDPQPITGMKFKTYFTVHLGSCLINGLELEI